MTLEDLDVFFDLLSGCNVVAWVADRLSVDAKTEAGNVEESKRLSLTCETQVKIVIGGRDKVGRSQRRCEQLLSAEQRGRYRRVRVVGEQLGKLVTAADVTTAQVADMADAIDNPLVFVDAEVGRVDDIDFGMLAVGVHQAP